MSNGQSDTAARKGRRAVFTAWLSTKPWVRRELIIASGGMVLAVVGAIFAPFWLLAASTAVIAGSLLALAVNAAAVPRSFRQLKKKMVRAQASAESHPILLCHYRGGIDRTARELDAIIAGRFNFTIWEVPQLSVDAMNLVDAQCILIFPLANSEALLTPKTGGAANYYHAMVAASQRMRAAGAQGVVRVFLLKHSDDVSQRLLDFVHANVADGIVVRVIFEDELPPRPLQVEDLDYGYYETTDGYRWIMLLRSVEGSVLGDVVDYAVDTDSAMVEAHRKYAVDILSRSHSVEDLMTLVTQPVNGPLWPAYFAQRGYEMMPPHGVSDEDADLVVSSAVDGISNPSESSVLILGFTPKLIRRLLQCKLASVESLDQFPTKPLEFAHTVTFHTGNWLDILIDRRFDAVVFDEALNNLSRLQLSLVFPQIARLLKPGGHIVGRVMGRFDEDIARKYAEKSPWQAVEDLRGTEATKHEDIAPLIICLLHSTQLAFTESTWSVNCERWNHTLTSLRDAGRITEAELKLWKLQFNFTLLSPTLNSLLREAARSGFSPFEIRAVTGGYVERWNDASDFYRIVNFEYSNSGRPLLLSKDKERDR